MDGIDNSRYADIIDMPHPVSAARPHMSNYDRAAQFSPFAALTGYEDCIREAARLTDSRSTLDENEIELLDARLRYIVDNIERSPELRITYFKPDKLKAGGEYITATVKVSGVDRIEGKLITSAGEFIPITDIYALSYDLSS